MKTIVAILFAAIGFLLSNATTSQQTIAPVAADLAPVAADLAPQGERLLLVYTANYYAVMEDGSTVEVLRLPLSEVIELAITCDEEMQETPQATY